MKALGIEMAANGRNGMEGKARGRTTIWRLFVTLAVLLGIAGSVNGARAAGSDRWVTAKASCDTGHGTTPIVRVTIVNHSGLTLSVAYNRGFSTSEAIGTSGLTGMSLADPGDVPVVKIANGATKTLLAPWIGRTQRQHEAVVALVVTNAGMFLPSCGERSASKITYDGPRPVLAGEESRESATIMAKNIGLLEALHAYPALYALLAPEVRNFVSYRQMACWYAGQYGPPAKRGTQAIFSTVVTGVKWVPWTWKVSGTRYDSVAEVTYVQEIGTLIHTEQTDPQVEHLVRGDDGVWRWFFGTSMDALNDQPGDCGLPATL